MNIFGFEIENLIDYSINILQMQISIGKDNKSITLMKKEARIFTEEKHKLLSVKGYKYIKFNTNCTAIKELLFDSNYQNQLNSHIARQK